MKKLFYILFISLAFASCSKKDDPQPSTPTLSASSTPQVTCSIDGTSFSMITNGSTIEGGDGSSNILATYPDSSTGIYESFIYNDANSVSFGIERGGLKFMGNPAPNASFNSFFHTGTYSYTTSGMDGISISYTDASGVNWSTYFGAGTQTGSTFKIDDQKPETLGTYYVLFKASFSCKLYNGLGQVKVVTNGVYIGSFENI